MRRRNPNTIWRQELSELSLLGRRKFSLDQLVCLFVVCNYLLFLAVGCTGHSLLLRVSFMEKGAMCVKNKEEGQCFQPVLPQTCQGEVKDFVTTFSLPQSSKLLAQDMAKSSSDWTGKRG